MMAPIARNTASNSRPNGHINGDTGASVPPPSTMAAQLISDLSTKGNNPSKEKDPDGLQQMMNEVAAEEQEFESRVEKDPAFVEDLDVKLERKKIGNIRTSSPKASTKSAKGRFYAV